MDEHAFSSMMVTEVMFKENSLTIAYRKSMPCCYLHTQSHLLQPLDVGIFGPVKNAMKNQLDRVIRTQIHTIRRHEFIESYYNARNIAFTKSNIESAWRGAGLFPFFPSKVCRIASNIPVC